ncbi:hypothetical protein EC957_009780 [Mortierella hygrophila]|uniref:Uncharacterized protein n=1 Tax=Mortierella hygrophila TaxID=979708 RepID=A0A9P6FBI5_9FUNG|nr:hypothetical protein EC957_009780 [Mortierella hygrophila]
MRDGGHTPSMKPTTPVSDAGPNSHPAIMVLLGVLSLIAAYFVSTPLFLSVALSLIYLRPSRNDLPSPEPVQPYDAQKLFDDATNVPSGISYRLPVQLQPIQGFTTVDSSDLPSKQPVRPCHPQRLSDDTTTTTTTTLASINQGKLSAQRELQRKRFQDLIDNSTKEKCKGRLIITYERLWALQGALNWLNDGNNSDLRSFKHWRLVLFIGFDQFELDFNENSEQRGEGVLTAHTYTDTKKIKGYEMGEMEIDTETLYTELMAMFLTMSSYSVTSQNCQHFVIMFVQKFNIYMTSKTEHYEGIHRKNPNHVTSASNFGSMFRSDSNSSR